MDWKSSINGFKTYLQLEKSLSENSVAAYVRDISKILQYLESKHITLQPVEIELKILQDFLVWANELGMTGRTQARTISGIKSFFKYLLIENIIQDDPTELLEAFIIAYAPDINLTSINVSVCPLNLQFLSLYKNAETDIIGSKNHSI